MSKLLYQSMLDFFFNTHELNESIQIPSKSFANPSSEALKPLLQNKKAVFANDGDLGEVDAANGDWNLAATWERWLLPFLDDSETSKEAHIQNKMENIGGGAANSVWKPKLDAAPALFPPPIRDRLSEIVFRIPNTKNTSNAKNAYKTIYRSKDSVHNEIINLCQAAHCGFGLPIHAAVAIPRRPNNPAGSGRDRPAAEAEDASDEQRTEKRAEESEERFVLLVVMQRGAMTVAARFKHPSFESDKYVPYLKSLLRVVYSYSRLQKISLDAKLTNFVDILADNFQSVPIDSVRAIDLDALFYRDAPVASNDDAHPETWLCSFVFNVLYVSTFLKVNAESKIGLFQQWWNWDLFGTPLRAVVDSALDRISTSAIGRSTKCNWLKDLAWNQRSMDAWFPSTEKRSFAQYMPDTSESGLLVDHAKKLAYHYFLRSTWEAGRDYVLRMVDFVKKKKIMPRQDIELARARLQEEWNGFRTISVPLHSHFKKAFSTSAGQPKNLVEVMLTFLNTPSSDLKEQADQRIQSVDFYYHEQRVTAYLDSQEGTETTNMEKLVNQILQMEVPRQVTVD